MLNTLLISRIQFAFTISFHILFPAFSIGLATFLAIMEGCWLKTKDPKFLSICRFYSKIFALTFGMGVVSGIVMEFQLGTNWSQYAHAVGPVLGSLFTYEVMTAFFIEAGFLGIMLFGWKRVSPTVHYLSTLAVVFGVTLSAFWILAANSWMQTPAGAHMVHDHFVVDSWLQVIFNHSTVFRFLHMLIAAYMTTLMVIAAISGFYLFKKTHRGVSEFCLRFVLVAMSVLVATQLFIGDEVGRIVHEHQPIKTAAIEGVWDTSRHVPFLVFAYPDQKDQGNKFSLPVPGLASFINTHRFDGQLIGLKSVPEADQPAVAFVFYSFRIMLGAWALMVLLVLLGWFLKYKKVLFTSSWYHRMLMFGAPLGFLAMETGWFVAEAGRQPWTVYNLLRTSDSVSSIPVRDTVISFVLMLIIYGVIFGYFYFKYLLQTIRKGPDLFDHDKALPFAYMGSNQGEDS